MPRSGGTAPRLAGVDLSADANIAILTNAHGGERIGANAGDDATWIAILDISDKSNPRLLSRIKDDDQIDYVHTATLDNNLLYLNPQAWAGYPQGPNPHIPIYDILRYTGEGGTRWPATAGPAEVQRSARQGVPYVPIATGSSASGSATPSPATTTRDAGAVLPAAPVRSRDIGRIRFTRVFRRLPASRTRRVVISFAFRNASGKRVGSTKIAKRAGRPARVTVFGGAVTGRYSWVASARGRTIGRGTLRVRSARMTLAPQLELSVGAR